MKPGKITFKNIFKLVAASLSLGVVGGGIGAAFSLLISYVTGVRTSNPWLLYFLPVCGILIVFLYKKLDVLGQGTNTILEAADNKQGLSPLLAVGIFISSAFSHLFGASVGREGAALQIGGSVALAISKLFKLNEKYGGILIRAGMAAVFSAVFGTPIAAFLFALEVVCIGEIHLKSVLPSLIASFTAFKISQLLGAYPERFALSVVPKLSFIVVLQITSLTILTAILSIGFCHMLKHSTAYAKKLIKSPYLRIVVGGILILALTLILGTRDYNGAGINVIERIFDGDNDPSSISFSPEAFILKLLFTCVSVACGFKGGEIVPTLFIGATFGAFLATVFGLPAPFGAALCMVLLFSGVTNCPLASIALAFELFSGEGFWYFIPTVALCFMISGKISLYSAQRQSAFLEKIKVF